MQIDQKMAGDIMVVHISGDITLNQGGSLRIANVTKKLKDLLVVTKLVTVFDSYDSEKEAVASFN